MNKIYWDKDKICILTDQIEAVEHKHCAMQLFFCYEKELEISVLGKKVECRCLLVNQNITHSFSSDNCAHFSIIIEPTSNLAQQLQVILQQKDYHTFDFDNVTEIVTLGYNLMQSNDIKDYQTYIQMLYSKMGIVEKSKIYDERIASLLEVIALCNCDEHSISAFAEKIPLSTSRLSHLFKEQIGIPLKSYIQLHQMQVAFQALLQGKRITEAAMLAHFDSPSHFAAVTKKMMGTPASISLKDSEFLKVF